MNILVGCEESQVVTRSFRNAGFEAFSCDLKSTRGNPDWHLQMDIKRAIGLDCWKLIILHPDCTAMAISGNRWYGKGTKHHTDRLKAIIWTLDLWIRAIESCEKVVLENPKSVIFPLLPNVQYVQPWMFGHTENKETGFAIHGLPQLKETDNVKRIVDTLPKSETDKVHRMPPSKALLMPWRNSGVLCYDT